MSGTIAAVARINDVALRRRADDALLEVRCHDGAAGDGFAGAARRLSNCPSGAEGGNLGWVAATDCAAEFAAVRGAAAVALRQQGFVTALRQYLQVLAGAAIIEGVDLERAAAAIVR